MCGDTQVDLTQALRELARRGANSVLVEGGPALNAQLVAGGLLMSCAAPCRLDAWLVAAPTSGPGAELSRR